MVGIAGEPGIGKSRFLNLGFILYQLGELAIAQSHLEQALMFYTPQQTYTISVDHYRRDWQTTQKVDEALAAIPPTGKRVFLPRLYCTRASCYWLSR